MRVLYAISSILLLVPQFAFAQFLSKTNIIEAYEKAASTDTLALKAGVQNPARAKNAAAELTKKPTI